MNRELANLADQIEAALILDDNLCAKTKDALGRAVASEMEDVDLKSTDEILSLAHDLKPGWDVAIHGTLSAPNGHWRSTIRRSAVRDNDAYIGVGSGATLPQALIAALLKALAQSSA